MECPYCDDGKAIARQTYYYSGTVFRERICKSCGKKVKTYEQEIFEDELEYQLFKDAMASKKRESRKKERTKVENK